MASNTTESFGPSLHWMEVFIFLNRQMVSSLWRLDLVGLRISKLYDKQPSIATIPKVYAEEALLLPCRYSTAGFTNEEKIERFP